MRLWEVYLQGRERHIRGACDEGVSALARCPKLGTRPQETARFSRFVAMQTMARGDIILGE
jgi:hypothetical protein